MSSQKGDRLNGFGNSSECEAREPGEEKAALTAHSGASFISHSISTLLVWSILMFFVPQLLGIQWFAPADFPWREAMALHGILVSAWMLLMLASWQLLKPQQNETTSKWISAAAIISSLLTGIGGLSITGPGISAGAMLQIAGMFCADFTALLCLFWIGRNILRLDRPGGHRVAHWGLLVTLVAISLATPLGHLAGALMDIGNSLPLHAQTGPMGTDIQAVMKRFAGSHSHEAIAGFIGAMVLVAVLQSEERDGGWVVRFEWIGCVLILLATLAQVAIYQYSAWAGWEPPTLFASGEGGMPLDDLVLSILGGGMLCLCPSLLTSFRKESSGRPERWRGIAFAVLIVSFVVAIIGMGIFIEFNESFFGHGEDAAPGVLNTQDYIRGHIVFGFTMIPLLFVGLVTLPKPPDTPLGALVVFGTIGVVILGAFGLAEWTLILRPYLLFTDSIAWGFIVLSISCLHLVIKKHRKR
jgi:hypothetical protein